MNTPYEAKGTKMVCNLPESVREVGDFWISTDGYSIGIYQQKIEEPPTQRISIPRATFNKLIDWYLKEQGPGK